jgi:predicted ribosomally synthesized peptide with SipW-like signal peptide
MLKQFTEKKYTRRKLKVKQNKRKTLPFAGLLLLVISCLILGGMTAYAAFTSKEEKTTLFQVGNLQTKISEVFSEPTTIMPDELIEKRVKITNTGTLNQFVRVMLHPEIRLEKEGTTRLLSAKIGDEVLLDIDEDKWKLGEDGYYYYLNVVEPGTAKTTDALFTQVKLKRELGLEYHMATFNLLIKIEAVNCAKDNYRKAWWQGSTPNSGALQKVDQQLAQKVE